MKIEFHILYMDINDSRNICFGVTFCHANRGPIKICILPIETYDFRKGYNGFPK